MDDLGAFQEFVKVLTSGGTGNAILLGVAWLLWKLDRRIAVLEVALGVVKVPQVALRGEGEKGSVKISALVGLVLVAIVAFFLSACSPTLLLGSAALLQGRTALQFNAGDFKAGVTLTLPKTVTMPQVIAPAAEPD